MSTAALSDHDMRVRSDVVEQLDWDADVDASGIGVSAGNGVVTLTGSIDTYAGKLAAERAAKRVRGVRAVANDLEVRLKSGRTDADIANDAARALELHAVPDTIQATVRSGHVVLTGKVGWLSQARAAEKAVRHIKGLRGVINHVAVAAGSTTRDVRHRIVEALHRDADIDARRLTVHVEDGVATLTGFVASWNQRDTAERAAANAPGITRVVNDLLIHPADWMEETH